MPVLPNHIVIIPDGNRRWQGSKFTVWTQPIPVGHERGAENVERITRAALELNIPCLSVWGLSLKNFCRSESELGVIFDILKRYFRKLARNRIVKDHDVRISAIGMWRDRFPKATVTAIVKAIETTRSHSRHRLNFLLADGAGAPPWPDDIPPIDLIIRTGEENGFFHLSDGMERWPMHDALLCPVTDYWPDFSPERFRRILDAYETEGRRFGK